MAEWCYHVTKTHIDFIVPLCRQAVDILSQLRILTGCSKYVFCNKDDYSKVLSEAALKAAFIAMDINTETEHTPHGFRSSFETINLEVLGWIEKFAVVDSQLAHNPANPNGRSYDRTQYLAQRRILMQNWADYLDDLRLSNDEVEKVAQRHQANLS